MIVNTGANNSDYFNMRLSVPNILDPSIKPVLYGLNVKAPGVPSTVKYGQPLRQRLRTVEVVTLNGSHHLAQLESALRGP
jgi:hypothetical protein